MKGNMKLDMVVHPKHEEELTTERFLTLQQMVRTLLPECGRSMMRSSGKS